MNIGEWLDMYNKIEKDFENLNKGDFVFINGEFYIFLEVNLILQNSIYHNLDIEKNFFDYGELEVIDYDFNIKKLVYNENTNIRKLTSQEEKDYKNYCFKKTKYLHSKYGEILEILEK